MLGISQESRRIIESFNDNVWSRVAPPLSSIALSEISIQTRSICQFKNPIHKRFTYCVALLLKAVRTFLDDDIQKFHVNRDPA